MLAESVWSKKRVVRQIGPTELLAVWDYEGKLESRHWDAGLLERVLTSRLRSPPATVLRAAAYPLFEYLMAKFYTPRKGKPHGTDGVVGVWKTAAVAYSPLEDKEEAGGGAAKADNAEVDLSVWAPPGETQEEAAAWELIRRRVVAWWEFSIEQDGI